MSNTTEQVCINIFKFICFAILIYMSTTQIQRFFANNDTSSISLKSFLSETEGNEKFPTFTVCMEEKEEGDLYDDTKITGISQKKYQKMLKGEIEMNQSIVSSNDPEEVMLNSEYIVCQLLVQSRDETVLAKWIKKASCADFLDTKTDIPIPMKINYRSPDKLCISPINSDQERPIREILFKLDLRPFYNDYKLMFTTVRFYLHGEGQLIRNFGNDVYMTKMADLNPYPASKTIKNMIEFSITQVNILRKRSDANIPCDHGMHDDDEYIRRKIADEAGCIPPYWAHFNVTGDKIKAYVCNSTSQLRKAYKEIKVIEEKLKMFGKPCKELSNFFSLQSEGTAGRDVSESGLGLKKTFDMKIKFLTDQFQEVTNSKDFGFESLWSGIGGFTGIFLGYSFLNVPEFLLLLKRKLKTEKN